MRQLILIILIFRCSWAISIEYSFETITSNEGLSQNDVLGIFQDSDGFIWFGTVDGLNRYDGYEFKVFRSSNTDLNSISGSMINSIVEDQYKNLWIGTLSNGVSKFNMLTEKFTWYKNTDANPNLITGNFIESLMCDSENNIWVSTPNGINILKQINKDSLEILKLTSIEDDPASISVDINSNAYNDSKGRIWIGSPLSLDLMIKGENGEIRNSFYHINRYNLYYDIGDILEVEEGHLFTAHQGLMLLKLDTIRPLQSKIISLDDQPIFKLVRDKHGDLWASSYKGLYRYEYKPNKEKPFVRANHFVYGKDKKSIKNNFVRSLCIDESGIVWIGTNGGGVSKYNPTKTKFRHYKNTDLKGSISYNKIFSVFEDKQHNIWIGTEGGGLNLLAAEKNKDYNNGFIQFDVNNSEGQNFVFEIIEVSTEDKQELWAGAGYNSRLIKAEKIGNDWEINKIQPEAFGHIMSLCQDEYGTIWAGSYNLGLNKYIPGKSGNQRIIYNKRNSKLPSRTIRSIVEDSKGRLWIGTTHGLMLMTREQKKKDSLDFTLFKNIPGDNKTISHNYIVPIIETSKGEIIVGTFSGGVNKYIEGETETTGSFTMLIPENTLPNNNIKKIIEDKTGDLWISTNKGISQFKTKSGQIRNFDISDGLQDMEFTDLSGCMLHDGEIIFGGVNGFNAFYPEELKEDTVRPRVVLTRLEINNAEIKTGEPINEKIVLENNVNATKLLTLTHKQNNLAIHFAALHFAVPLSNQFKYMLEGFDSRWITTSPNSRFAKYTNLDAGKYTFKVMASNSDGHWCKEPKCIEIYIKPPFWLNPWFIVLITLTSLSIISIIIWFRFYIIKQQNIHLEKEVQIRTKEISAKNIQLEENASILNDKNTQLEERQQIVEEQSEELLTQKDELEEQSKELIKQRNILIKQKASLEEINATKDKFYSILAHDIKGPFNSILGFLELLQVNFKTYSNQEKSKMIGMIFDSAGLLYELIQNLLDWSRSQRGLIPFKPIKIEVKEEINSIISIYEAQLNKKDISLDFNTKESSLDTVVDKNMFSTILRNLISNAIKYTPSGGKINIEAINLEKHTQIKVIDSGVGMPIDIVEQIFKLGNKFTTEGTEQEKGTGLGLVLCKEFVDAHKGKIWVESEEGKGSSFIFTIPL